MISEQIGEKKEDLTFHFDSDFNLIVLFGRSGALAAVALWIYTAWGKKTGATIVALAVLVVAGGIFFKDFPTLKSYAVHVTQEGLDMNIPPDPQTRITWDSIETLELEGFEYMSVPVMTSTPFNPGTAIELPDWETMEITTKDGTIHTVNLKLLSIEQRQILAQAIVRRAGLVEE
jgi:hypothetical protein